MPAVTDSARYLFNISEVLPGDILLSRIPMDLDNELTWESHLIQALTRSYFSFAALCVGDGLFIEAVGTGVARLPLWKAGVRDSANVRVLRPREDHRWAAIRAAARGQAYLEQGFYQSGAPKPKCTAFQDVRRAAASNSDIVINAYLEAGLPLDKGSESGATVFAGDLVDCALFEDVTQKILQPLASRTQVIFNLDDDTLRKRIHYWDVETQLKVLCKYEVRRILELKSERPSSLSELEVLIAKNEWRSLDSALHHSLRWYRYDKLYQVKQNQLLQDILSCTAETHFSALYDGRFADQRETEYRDILKLIEMEVAYCKKQQNRYNELISTYKCASFLYMYDLFIERESKLNAALNSLNERVEGGMMDNLVVDYVQTKEKYGERPVHKKYYEIN